MKSLRALAVLGLLSLSSMVQSQTIESPSEGKSLVYFVRTNGAGAIVNFKYFDGEKYLGKFSGVNYMIYECEPGKHLFWSASENRDYIEADLEAGKTYFIEVVPRMGAMKAAVRIFPVAKTDAKRLKRINKILAKKGPKVLDPKEVESEAPEWKNFAKNGLERYEKLKAKNSPISQLTREMFMN